MVWENTIPGTFNLTSQLFTFASLSVTDPNSGSGNKCMTVRPTGSAYILDNSEPCTSLLTTVCEFDVQILPTSKSKQLSKVSK